MKGPLLVNASTMPHAIGMIWTARKTSATMMNPNAIASKRRCMVFVRSRGGLDTCFTLPWRGRVGSPACGRAGVGEFAWTELAERLPPPPDRAFRAVDLPLQGEVKYQPRRSSA